MSVVYVLLVAHFVADFVAQSDWMAVNKGKRWDALALHVGVYGVVLGLFMVPFWQPHVWGWWLLGNMAAHFAQDAITARINARFWFFRREVGIFVPAPHVVPARELTLVNPWMPDVGNRHWFFVAIGADQLLHYVTLFATAEWLLQ